MGKVDGKAVVKINPKFYRPAEVESLLGDSAKAKRSLGWTPKTSFKQLVKMMVDSDIKLLSHEK